MKINDFRGDLTDISAEKEALALVAVQSTLKVVGQLDACAGHLYTISRCALANGR